MYSVNHCLKKPFKLPKDFRNSLHMVFSTAVLDKQTQMLNTLHSSMAVEKETRKVKNLGVTANTYET